MSFLKSLFGWVGKPGGETGTAKRAEHKGFIIEARPYPEGGRYQTAGLISRDVDGVRKEHKFIRADSFTTLDEAADFALSKGRQIVDEQGDRLFK
ncbi:MAG TPA: HlyU family transcriptional regulator [Aestuariivirgaceae bacterium]